MYSLRNQSHFAFSKACNHWARYLIIWLLLTSIAWFELLTDSHECETCARKYRSKRTLLTHQRLVHSAKVPFLCNRCPFKTSFPASLRRHNALIHLRRRSTYIPRRSISTKKKRSAIKYWETSTASTPEKRQHIEKTFKLTPKSQLRLFAKKEAFSKAKKCLFRIEGGGRNADEFWAPIEAKLLERFKARRAMGCIVLKTHLVNLVFSICGEMGINLAEEEKRRGWKSAPKLIRQRIDRFCVREKIVLKRASRQLHKNPAVGHICLQMSWLKAKV